MFKINMYLGMAGKTLMTGGTTGVAVVVMTCNGNNKRITAYGKNSSEATLAAVAAALNEVKKDSIVTFWTDNSYIRNAINCVNAWQEKGWTLSTGFACKNVSALENLHAKLNRPIIKGVKVAVVKREQLKDVYKLAYESLPQEEEVETEGCAF
jgi:ribonuclease HI